ncbi:MAG: hypothetical protein WDW36_008374 [Sanguina aurantia]
MSHVAMDYDGPREYLFVLESESDPAFNVLQPLLTHHPAASAPSKPATPSNGCCVSYAMGDNARRAPAHSADPTPGAAGSGVHPCNPHSGGRCSADSTGCTGPVLSTPMCSKGDQHTPPDPAQADSSHSGCSVSELDFSDGGGATCAAPLPGGGRLGGGACHGGRGGGGAPRRARPSCGVPAVRIVIAGLSQQCSQKAHNLVAGVEASCPASSYILCLDDDVMLQPTALSRSISLLEGDDSLFMSTGYPFDIPPVGAGLAAFCTLAYHLPLTVAFSVAERATFVWGGCMLLRRGALQPCDHHGILRAWREGGYSDDLTLASICARDGLAVATPSFAIFPQRWGRGPAAHRPTAAVVHHHTTHSMPAVPPGHSCTPVQLHAGAAVTVSCDRQRGTLRGCGLPTRVSPGSSHQPHVRSSAWAWLGEGVRM